MKYECSLGKQWIYMHTLDSRSMCYQQMRSFCVGFNFNAGLPFCLKSL